MSFINALGDMFKEKNLSAYDLNHYILFCIPTRYSHSQTCVISGPQLMQPSLPWLEDHLPIYHVTPSISFQHKDERKVCPTTKRSLCFYPVGISPNSLAPIHECSCALVTIPEIQIL